MQSTQQKQQQQQQEVPKLWQNDWHSTAGIYDLLGREEFLDRYSKAGARHNTIRVLVEDSEPDSSGTGCSSSSSITPLSKMFVAFGFCKSRPEFIAGTRVLFVRPVCQPQLPDPPAAQADATQPQLVLRSATIKGMVAAEGKRKGEYGVCINFDEPILCTDVCALLGGSMQVTETDCEAEMLSSIHRLVRYNTRSWGDMDPSLRVCSAAKKCAQESSVSYADSTNLFRGACIAAEKGSACREKVIHKYVTALACFDGLHRRGFTTTRVHNPSGLSPEARGTPPPHASKKGGNAPPQVVGSSRSPPAVRQKRARSIPTEAAEEKCKRNKSAAECKADEGMRVEIVSTSTARIFMDANEHPLLQDISRQICAARKAAIASSYAKYQEAVAGTLVLNPVAIKDTLGKFEDYMRVESGAAISRSLA